MQQFIHKCVQGPDCIPFDEKERIQFDIQRDIVVQHGIQNEPDCRRIDNQNRKEMQRFDDNVSSGILGCMLSCMVFEVAFCIQIDVQIRN